MNKKTGLRDVGSIPIKLRARLDPPLPGDELITASVGPSGDAIAMWAAPEDAPALHGRSVSPGGASFPKPRADGHVPVRITRCDPALVARIDVPVLGIAHPFVQPLPDGRILIVGARCRWRPEGADRNAVILDHDGVVLRDGVLGDGIADVLTTPSGRIWVGYFDEGVFGNFGWGGPGPAPMGSHGLIQFTQELKAAWEYPYDAEGGDISDVYALNVDGEVAWLCYYTDFPLVRVEGGTIRSWKNSAGGPTAIAVSDTHCAMLTGAAGRLRFGKLGESAFKPTSEARITLPDGGKLPRSRVIARGETFHFFIDAHWYTLSLGDLP